MLKEFKDFVMRGPLRAGEGFQMRPVILVTYSLLLPILVADQVTFKNGDRITGSVVKKDAAAVILKSPVVGLVTIPWDQVQTISTDAPVNVVLSTGESVQGKLTPRDQAVDIEGANTKQSVPLTQIATVRDAAEQRSYERLLSPGFGQLWAGTAALGFAGAQGNAKTRTLTMRFNASRVTTSDKTTVYFGAIRSNAVINNVSAQTAQAARGGVGYSHNLSPRLFVNAFNDYEYDQFQNLDLRFVLGGGLGFIAWKGEAGRLDLLGGMAYNRESFAPPAPNPSFTRNSAEAYFGDEYTYKISEAMSFYQNARIFPNVTNGGEFRMNFDIGANTKLANWLVWNIAFSDRYLSNPVPGRLKNDLLYTTGVGITFAQ